VRTASTMTTSRPLPCMLQASVENRRDRPRLGLVYVVD
jgi:hypothetical protein